MLRGILEERITDGLALAEHAEDYRVDYNTVRPLEALSWNRPANGNSCLADPDIPNFDRPEVLPST